MNKKIILVIVGVLIICSYFIYKNYRDDSFAQSNGVLPVHNERIVDSNSNNKINEPNESMIFVQTKTSANYSDESVAEVSKAAKRDKAVEFYISNIRSYAEVYYDGAKSWQGVCSGGDQDIVNLLIKLREKSGSANVSCVSDTKSYAVSALLAGGKYQCADSYGTVVATSHLNTKSSCPH